MNETALDIDPSPCRASFASSILLVQKEHDVAPEAIRRLREKGLSLDRIERREDVLQRLEHQSYALAIVDSEADDRQGLDLLDRIHAATPDIPVVITTAAATVRHAVEAMQRGAVDYLMKPVAADMLETCVLRHLPAAMPPNHPRREGRPQVDKPFITQCPEVEQVLATSRAIAGSRATVLITGESGTGKEVLAAYIHRHSCHGTAPYIAVNCAALPDTLMESELFGYEKGAFTGALSRREGKFEQAGEGTLVLDEISEMPLALQAKLLRVLQERRIDRIGSDRQVAFDAQVIAISNRDLDKRVREGRMREDLYYRINVIPLHLPPLRERREDIPLLVDHFLERFSNLYQREAPEANDEIMAALRRNDWRGNVRELENTIERAVLIGAFGSLPGTAPNTPEASPEATGRMTIRPGLSVKAVEEVLIRQTLQEVNDHREKAAKMLGISVRTLRNKLREYKERTEELEKDGYR